MARESQRDLHNSELEKNIDYPIWSHWLCEMINESVEMLEMTPEQRGAANKKTEQESLLFGLDVS